MTAPAVATRDGSPVLWLTPPEVADLLRVSENTVVRWFRAGYIPGLNEGVLYRLSAAFIRDLKAAIDRGQNVVISDFARTWGAS